MGFNVLRAVLDLVETPPAVDPYTTLKGRLVGSPADASPEGYQMSSGGGQPQPAAV